MKRRDLLRGFAIGAAGLMVPGIMESTDPNRVSAIVVAARSGGRGPRFWRLKASDTPDRVERQIRRLVSDGCLVAIAADDGKKTKTVRGTDVWPIVWSSEPMSQGLKVWKYAGVPSERLKLVSGELVEV